MEYQVSHVRMLMELTDLQIRKNGSNTGMMIANLWGGSDQEMSLV